MTALTGRSLEPSVFTAWRLTHCPLSGATLAVTPSGIGLSSAVDSLSLHRALFSEAKFWKSRRRQFSSICLGFRQPG